jgi:nicotinate (nicotinamide) nucleotide adenylyltransferase
MDEYEFPTSRLRRRIEDSERTPLVLIACGSFSPITFLHLRMFEMAADYARFNSNFEVVGAYLSCVGDAYKKSGLVKAEHRINMCTSAVAQSSWISVDPWEALHGEYLETAKVLDHFEHEINGVLDGVETPVGRKKCRIALLAGADLIQTMSTPGVWAPKDIDYILQNYGAFIVEVSRSHSLSTEDAFTNNTLSAWAQTLMKLSPHSSNGRTTSGSSSSLCKMTSHRPRSASSAAATCQSATSSRSLSSITSKPTICTTRMVLPAPAVAEEARSPARAMALPLSRPRPTTLHR